MGRGSVSGDHKPVERSNSDPATSVPTNPGPLVQRVTPTRRPAAAPSPPPPTSPKSLNFSQSLLLGKKAVAGDMPNGTVLSSEEQEDHILSSPLRYGSTSLLFPALTEDPKHPQVSTPLPRDCTSQHRFAATAAATTSPDLSELSSRCSELESRLKVQTDINKELKRLLVASMGSDLQHCLNHIAEEKATISQDLDASLQRLADNYEEIDRVSIQCDIWRSKFLASRLMIDELAGWKAEETRQLRESQRALHCMLQERAELRALLSQCGQDLSKLVTSRSEVQVDGESGGFRNVNTTTMEIYHNNTVMFVHGHIYLMQCTYIIHGACTFSWMMTCNYIIKLNCMN